MARVFSVRKPTEDGIVTSIEAFDARNRNILLMFGARKPGKPELEEWRTIVAQRREAGGLVMKRRTAIGLGSAAAAMAALPAARAAAAAHRVGRQLDHRDHLTRSAPRTCWSASTRPASIRGGAKLPQVGYMRALSAEGVLSLKPTLIIATTAAGPAGALDQLKATGIEVMILPDHYDYDSVVTKIAAIGKVTGKVAEADAMIAKGREAMKSLADKLAAAKTHPRVLFLLVDERRRAAGRGPRHGRRRHHQAGGRRQRGRRLFGLPAAHAGIGHRLATPTSSW